jgi:hypothetical protein
VEVTLTHKQDSALGLCTALYVPARGALRVVLVLMLMDGGAGGGEHSWCSRVLLVPALALPALPGGPPGAPGRARLAGWHCSSLF